MSISQNFVPSVAIVNGSKFYDHTGKQLDTIQTDLLRYIETFGSKLIDLGEVFSTEEFRSMQTAAALIDALAKTRLTPISDSFCNPVIESGHHSFNVFYKAENSTEWKLQFANSSYLEKIGTNLSDRIQSSEISLMHEFYSPETIESFNSAARTSQGEYKARFIEMDNIPKPEEDTPAFFWYRKEFNHPNGGKIQIRIGMNGTGLSVDQRQQLIDIYNLSDILRKKDINEVYYSAPSYGPFISRIKEKISLILSNNSREYRNLLQPFQWLQMILEIADDVIKNSPFPLTIVDGKGNVEQISPVYATMVGYRVEDILKPGFFDKIYPGIEGTMVRQSIQHYERHGYYPEGASFLVSRGKRFASVEENNNLHSLKSLELIPSPHTFYNGTVRLNTAKPFESFEGSSGIESQHISFEVLHPDENGDSGTQSSINNVTNWLNEFNSK